MEYIISLNIPEKSKKALTAIVRATKEGKGLTTYEVLRAGDWGTIALLYQYSAVWLAHEWVRKEKSLGGKNVFFANLNNLRISPEEAGT